MKKLSKYGWLSVSNYIIENARPLEKAIFNFKFCDDSVKKVIHQLKKYQNEDGGFGNGLEPDFLMAPSSPMATSMAIRLMESLPSNDEADEMMKEAMRYLEQMYDKERKGWYSVSKAVNDAPHAPWWHFLESEHETIIDKSWGNPSAEIIGYMYKHKPMITKLDVEMLVDEAVERLLLMEDFTSEHEIYCYIRLYNLLDENRAVAMHGQLVKAIDQLINVNVSEWHSYVPTPIKFIQASHGDHFGIMEPLIEMNLDFIVDELEQNDYLDPNWNWGESEYDFEPSKGEWRGILTLEALELLRRFKRV